MLPLGNTHASWMAPTLISHSSDPSGATMARRCVESSAARTRRALPVCSAMVDAASTNINTATNSNEVFIFDLMTRPAKTGPICFSQRTVHRPLHVGGGPTLFARGVVNKWIRYSDRGQQGASPVRDAMFVVKGHRGSPAPAGRNDLLKD